MELTTGSKIACSAMADKTTSTVLTVTLDHRKPMGLSLIKTKITLMAVWAIVASNKLVTLRLQGSLRHQAKGEGLRI